jgi:hypothetical protein
MKQEEFRAMPEKLNTLSKQASALLGRASTLFLQLVFE